MDAIRFAVNTNDVRQQKRKLTPTMLIGGEDLNPGPLIRRHIQMLVELSSRWSVSTKFKNHKLQTFSSTH